MNDNSILFERICDNNKIKLQVTYDDCSDALDSPRNCDNLCNITTYYRNHSIGDIKNCSLEEMYNNIIQTLCEEAGGLDKLSDDLLAELDNNLVIDVYSALVAAIEKEMDKYFIWLPIYLYNHSSIAISTQPFNCRWDSGRIGYIYMTKAAAQDSFASAPAVLLKHVYELLTDEVKTYNQFINGDVYRWQVLLKDSNNNWFIENSCGSYYNEAACEADGVNAFFYYFAEYEANELSPATTPIAPHGDFNQLI